MTKKTVRAGIVGAGFSASFHFEAIKKVYASLLSPDALLNAADFPSLTVGHTSSGNNASLEGLINQKLQSALAQIDLQDMNNLYDMVLHQMERPLINIVLEKTRGNQVKAAEVLGINRNTLRKKIQTLNITAKRS